MRVGVYAVMLLFAAMAPQAEAQTPIACGELVTGSISSALERDTYALGILAGDVVSIRINETPDAGMWPKLEFYTPNGTLVRSQRGSLFAQVDATLSTSGVYTFVVSDGYDTTRTGNYNLVWQRVNRPCGAVPLSCGQLITNSVSAPQELDFYALELSAGDAVTIRVNETPDAGMWPNLELYAPDGTLVRSQRGSLSAQIDVATSVSGTYTLIVNDRYDTTRTGNYSLVWQPTGRPCSLSISFSASPGSLNFLGPAGSALTAPQQLELRSDFPGLPWRATVRIISGGIWLRVSSDFGQMPAAIQVTADASNLSAGTYQGSIEILAADASPPSQVIPVTFTVGGGRPPGLSIDPGSLSFRSVLGEPVSAQSLRIGNSGTGTLSWRAESSTTTGAWLSALPLSGLASASLPGTVQVSVNAGGLGEGSYSGRVLLTSVDTGQTVSVAVTLSISSNEGVLLLSQNSLLFRAVEAGGVDPPQTIGVLNIGGGSVDWSAEAVVRQPVNWLRLSPASGRSVGGSATIPETTIAIAPGTLAAGFYVGLIRFTGTGANNSPQTLRVDLQVLPRGTPLGAVVRPTGLIFVGAAGGAAPGAQEISVATPEAGPIEFISASLGGDWVTRTPDSGTTTRQTAGRISVRAQPGSLTSDIYRAGLTVLTRNDGELHPVNLLYVLLPQGASAPTTLSYGGLRLPGARAEGCAPTRLLLQFTSVFTRFNAVTGWPSLIRLDMRDDCGNPAEGGAAVLAFSSGDPPLVLNEVGQGQYLGTWRPNDSGSLTTVTARGSWNNLSGEATVTAAVGGNPNAQAAILNQGGVLLGAGFTRGPVAPGSIITLFGRNLAARERAASTVPLPTSLEGVRVLIGDREAPLFYVGPGQVNAQVPSDLAPNRQLQIVVETNGVPSAPEPFQTTSSRPGIFTLGGAFGDQGAILIGNTNRLAMPVTPGVVSGPVGLGGVISIYSTGLGRRTRRWRPGSLRRAGRWQSSLRRRRC